MTSTWVLYVGLWAWYSADAIDGAKRRTAGVFLDALVDVSVHVQKLPNQVEI